MPNLEELRQHAKMLAQNHVVSKKKRLSPKVFPRVDKDDKILIKAYKQIDDIAKERENIVPAAEWLLDNFYMITEQVKEIQYNFPKHYYRELPVLETGEFKDLPRIYAIISEMISYNDSVVDEETIIHFIKGYQEEVPLTNDELWAIPFMIRIALIKKISNTVVHVAESLAQRREADRWAHRLLAALTENTEELKRLISEHDAIHKQLAPAYVERFLQHFRDQEIDVAPVLRWIDERLALQGTSVDEIIQFEHQKQATYQVSMGNAVTSLRFLSGFKWEKLFEELSLVEQILNRDPAGVYPLMEFSSRDYYRNQIKKIAKTARVDELTVARKAVECSARAPEEERTDERLHHVGYYLIGKGRKQLEEELGIRETVAKRVGYRLKNHPAGIYLGSITILTAGLLGLVVFYLRVSDNYISIPMLILITAAAFVPVLSVVVNTVNWIVTHILPPCHLPKLELKEGIPDEFRTMVVVPTLLTSEKRVQELIENIEVYYLANQEKNLYFALIGDFKDSNEPDMPEDERIINTAIKATEELNRRYAKENGNIFFFFHRRRQWNPLQRKWMGWERKRGALVEFNRLLKGAKDTSYYVKVGDLSILPSIKYVITLDADTQLPRDTAKKLVGTIAHPLNRPLLDKFTKMVVEGYGIIQPRISVSVDSASRSFFTLVFSGETGMDPYTTAISDVYQDLFCEGIFTGKGIYDVEVFNTILKDAIPENTILSHDLLEGAYVRAGLVTDIELIDGYPSNYIAYSMRLHRWVRGDWQLIPWLLPRIRNAKGEKVKNPLSLVSKWKILDNMRRSLVTPALFVLLFCGLTVLPGRYWLWIVLILLNIAFPVITEFVDFLISRCRSTNFAKKISDFLFEIRNDLWQSVFFITFLAYQTYLMSDAIVRTLIRVFFTHRNMLEWVTAADAEKRFKENIKGFWYKMWPSTIISLFFCISVAFLSPSALAGAILLSAVWAVAFAIAYQISRPRRKKVPVLSEEQIKKLRLIARKTWKYFEDFVGSEDNWLPPDNYQEDPPTGVAHKTSPTNMGLFLLSVLAARDLGYIGTREVVERVERTVSTMRRLKRWNGHFYNWYDTRTLAPMRPLYVSSVDSGNLAVYLITLKQGIEELIRKPLFGKEILAGLGDLTDIHVNMVMENIENEIGLIEWKKILNSLKGRDKRVDEDIKKYESEMKEFTPWVDLLFRISDFLSSNNKVSEETLQKLKDLYEKLNRCPSALGLLTEYDDILDSLSEAMISVDRDGQTSYSRQIKNWLKNIELGVAKAHAAARSFVLHCQHLTDQIDELIEDMDFRKLYDEKLELFSIGYNAEAGKLTDSYYDLLASEARQTSFVAIAKGDVKQKHWFRLGRPLTLIGGLRALLSWSGTMFEYLMPLLIMKNYDYTLLDETYTAVVNAQKQYGEQKHLPWGVSESAFYAFDLHLHYQYKAFGVPRLGLKRGLINDIVIAPYATILALPVDPVSSIRNIEALIKNGLDGPYGLYEAIDYTPERLPRKRKSMIVKSFMAHHQGMSLLALDNFLNNNIMQERFHSAPIVKATELLLKERIPKKEVFIKKYDKERADNVEKIKYQEIRTRRKFATANTIVPETHLLSNGTYSVMVTNSGGGFSRYQGISISRWREDLTRDNWGMYFYIHDLDSGTFWSAAYQPYCSTPDDYQVTFEPHRAVFFRREGDIETLTEITVSPENNAEVRRITLTNCTNRRRVLEVTSYFEPVLVPFEADLAHPAFNKLFINTEFLDEYNALLATRRPRDSEEKTIWLIHTSVLEGENIGSIQYETDRSKFVGRGRDLSHPQAMEPNHPLSNTAGAVLDPVMSLRHRVIIGPGEKARISFITAAADTREDAVALAREYQNPAVASRAFELAWTHSQVEMRYLKMSAAQVNIYQKMAAHILYTNPGRRVFEGEIKKNKKGQSALWAYGISGDLPIVLVRINKIDQIDIAKQMLTAHEYWRLKGLYVDLVFLNEYGNSYEQPLQDKLRDIVAASHARDLQDKPGGVFLRRADTIPDEDITLLVAAARLVLSGDSGTLGEQLKKIMPKEEPLPPALKAVPFSTNYVEKPVFKKPDLLFFNDLGGFEKNGREYVIYLRDNYCTPMPWSNIVSNDKFGFLVTESGSSYTWSGNSRENKLTPWSNDPVIDPSGEIIYIRDETSGEFWTVTPLPVREEQPYIIRHGQGYSIFEHTSHGIVQRQLMFVPMNDPVKVCRVTLKNVSDSTRELSITYYVEWVLGVSRQKNVQFIETDVDAQKHVLLARNPYNEEFSEMIAFVACSMQEHSFTCDRTEFIGRNGNFRTPEAMKREGLSGRCGIGYDPCAAVQAKLQLKPGEEKDVIFILGEEKSIERVRMQVDKYRDIGNVMQSLQEVEDFWERKLGILQVYTPDTSMNIMLNRWLLYQVLACRVWARTAFYQAGGAYGFRDQLQDVMALVYSAPEKTREQIILSAAHQFREGDVQHWWHPPFRGIRTRIKDNLLFLPYVTSDYIEVTGDWSILEEEIHFLEDEPLKPEEKERYTIPGISGEKASLYEHCVRAIDSSICFGEHGLPLMGTGDWNDGMNKVGHRGKGESVWLGFFLYTVLKRFIPVCKAMKDFERAERYEKVAQELAASIENNAWDGKWYRRAYFDDGLPLGSEQNPECKIDSLPQSWSIISEAGKKERVQEAMRSVEHYLIEREEGLIKLFTPPFDKSSLEPGYIKAYVPGVRENGGQYTHAAIWVILAFAKLGDGNNAGELFYLVNPVNHARTWIEVWKYKVEPYVTAADVYALPPHTGRGGWTWYTGSAAWMYRVGIEWILGFKLRGDKFTVNPCIPSKWTGYRIAYRYKNTVYDITVENPNGVSKGVKNILLDGKECPDRMIPLVDDGGKHRVLVILG